MQDTGWIKIHRKIKNSWVFENPDFLKAWLVILLEANVEDEQMRLKNGNKIICHRSEKVYSLEKWANLFGKGWTKMKVFRFFKRLELEMMIKTKSERKLLHLSVLNYDVYQCGRDIKCDDYVAKKVIDLRIRETKEEDNENLPSPFSAIPETSGRVIEGNSEISYNWQSLNFDGITELHFAKWAEAFPAIDVPLEIKRMESWLAANGKSRKNNFAKFIHCWLSRAKDSPRIGIQAFTVAAAKNYKGF